MKSQVEELNKLGFKYFNRKDYVNAEIQYKKVLELDANHINTLNYLGLIFYNTRD